MQGPSHHPSSQWPVQATIRPAPTLVGRLRRLLARGLTALLFVGILTAARPAKAMIVFDPSVWAQTVQEVTQAVATLHELEQTYLLFNAVYTGIRDWQSLGWVGVIDMVNLPFFDGVAGIDDLRDLATLTDMSVSELQQLFGECATIQRLMNDPAYRASQTRQTQVALMNTAFERERMRKIVFARAMKQEQQQMNNLSNQASTLEARIQAASAMDPADESTITSCQAELSAILVKQQALKDSLWSMMKKDEDKQQHDEAIFRSSMHEAGYTDTAQQVQDSMKLARNFAGIP